MSVSTTTDFNLDIDEIIQDAFEHLGGPANTGQDSRTARRSLNLLLTDWSNRGILLWKTGFTNQTMTDGTASYSLAEDVVAVTEAIIRRDNQDIEMDRISMEEYLKIPDKTTTGRPIQFATHRQRDNVDIYVWPTPENSTDIVRMWTVNRTNDFNNSSDNADVPYRFLPCLVSGLAYYLSLKRPGISAQRSQILKNHYEEQLLQAMEEDRERVSFRAVPRLRTI
tara:strand:- start:2915 stop:3586 length:672 start_codon:yes stop_codon:yes gene_type:complete